MATQSASRACLTFTISRLPGTIRTVEALGDHAVQAGALEGAQPLRTELGVFGGARDVAPLLLRCTRSDSASRRTRNGSPISEVSPGGQRIETDEVRRSLLGEHPHPALGGVDPLRQRLPVQPDPAVDLPRHHDLAVEHAARREFVAQRVEQFREVPAEVLAVARQQHHLVAVAEHQRAEAVPLRLVGPRSRVVGHLGWRPWPASGRSAASPVSPRFPSFIELPAPGQARHTCRPRGAAEVIRVPENACSSARASPSVDAPGKRTVRIALDLNKGSCCSVGVHRQPKESPMRRISPDSWGRPNLIRRTPACTTHAYLWTSGADGNVLFYSTVTPDSDFDNIADLGGIAHHYLSHRDEAGPMLAGEGGTIRPPACTRPPLNSSRSVNTPMSMSRWAAGMSTATASRSFRRRATPRAVPVTWSPGARRQALPVHRRHHHPHRDGRPLGRRLPSQGSARQATLEPRACELIGTLAPDVVISSAYAGDEAVHAIAPPPTGPDASNTPWPACRRRSRPHPARRLRA